MMYVKWFVLASFGILVTLVNVVFSPLIALFINQDGYLPSWLGWFQTYDNPAIGEESFRVNQMGGSNSIWYRGMMWAIRNPGYGYDHAVGLVVEKGAVFNTNNPAGLEWAAVGQFLEGTIYRTLEQSGRTYWEFVWVKRWTSNHYSRVKLGWVLWTPMCIGDRRSIELTISPWMKVN